MTPERERLKTAIENRAVELRLKLNKVAQRADMSAANFLRIRTGEVALTPLAIAAIEHALEWESGSVQAILDGREPTPRRYEPTLSEMPAGIGIDPREWAKWAPEDRDLVIAAVRAATARARREHGNDRPGSAA